MKIIDRIKSWYNKRTSEQTVVHFRLPSGRTFDAICNNYNTPAKKELHDRPRKT